MAEQDRIDIHAVHDVLEMQIRKAQAHYENHSRLEATDEAGKLKLDQARRILKGLEAARTVLLANCCEPPFNCPDF